MPFDHRRRLRVVALVVVLLLACQFGSRRTQDEGTPTTSPSPTAPARVQAVPPTPTATAETPTPSPTPSPSPTATLTPTPSPSPTPELPDAGPLPAIWTGIEFGHRNRVLGPPGVGQPEVGLDLVSRGMYHPHDLALDAKGTVVYALGRCAPYSQSTASATGVCLSAFDLRQERVLSPGAVELPVGVHGEGRLYVARDTLYLHQPWAGELYALDRETLTVHEAISDVYGISFDGHETTYVVTIEGLTRLGEDVPARPVDRKYGDAPVEIVAAAGQVYVLEYASLQIFDDDLERVAAVELEEGQSRTLALDRTNGRLYIGSYDGLYILDPETYQLSKAPIDILNVRKLVLDPSGTHLYALARQSSDWFGQADVVVVDAESWEVQTLFSTLSGMLRDLILDKEGDRLLIASYEDHALIPINLASGVIQPRLPLGIQVMEVIVDDRLYVSDSAGWVHVLDRRTYDDVGRVYGGRHISLDVVHRRLYAGDPRLPEVTAFDAESLAVEQTIPQLGKPRANAATGEVVVVNRRFYVFDGASGELRGELLPGIGQPSEACPFCYYRVAREVVVDAQRGLTTTITYMPWPGKPGPRESIDYDPASGRAYYSLLTGGYVLYSSIATYPDLSQLEGKGQPVLTLEGLSGDIKLDPPARRLYVARGDMLFVLDSESLKRIGRIYTDGWTPTIAAVDGELGRLYTALGDRLLVWTRTGGAPPAPLPHEPFVVTNTVASILPSPNYAEDGTLLATINGRLCRSTDRGRTWQRLRGGLPEFGEYVYSANAAFSPDYAADGTIFVGISLGDTHGEGVYRSTDGGETWQSCSDGLYDLRVYRVVPSPTFARDRALLAYARIQNGEALYRSTDGCESWRLVLRQTSYGQPPLPRLGEMFFQQGHPPQFQCDYEGVCQRSDDGGETWTSFDTGGAQLDRLEAYALSPHFSQDRTVYFLTENDLYRYQEQGRRWSVCTLPLFGGRDYMRYLTDLAVAAAGDATHDVFIGSAGGEFYRFAAQDLPWAVIASAFAPPVVVPTPTPCAQAIDERFQLDGTQVLDRLGCAIAPGAEAPAAFQPFERGMMFWRGDLRRIYVLQQDATWASYEDTWAEDQPDHDPNLVPPEGLYQPMRGFGKVWRERLAGPEAEIGWANAPERAFALLVQPFERGLSFVGAEDEVYVLHDDGAWEVE